MKTAKAEMPIIGYRVRVWDENGLRELGGYEFMVSEALDAAACKSMAVDIVRMEENGTIGANVCDLLELRHKPLSEYRNEVVETLVDLEPLPQPVPAGS